MPDSTPKHAPLTVTGRVASQRDTEHPERVGRFVVVGPLGSGGMGVVMAAYDPELDRKVALKLIRPERTGALAQARMLREAQAMAKLSHPNVVQVYDVGAHGRQTYIAMELVEGSTLRQWLHDAPRRWRQVLEVFVAAGRGLSAAHALGIVHRDFKPDNVLISEEGRVRVADFGIAGWAGQVEGPVDQGVANSFLRQPLTSTGAVIGTPRYMSPEQHAGDAAGPASDQFSFCVSVFEALYGVLPFSGRTVSELVEEVQEGRVREPPDAPSVPTWLARAVRTGLAPDPTQRHPDLAHLVDVLERYPRRVTRRRRFAAGALVAGAVSVSVPLYAAREPEEPCTAGAERLEQVWESRRDAVRQSLESSGPSDTVGAILGSLDRFSERWAAADREMCLGHQDGTVSAKLLDAAVSCLDRRLASLDAAAELALQPSVDRSTLAGAVAKLADPRACANRDALRRLAPPPVDPDAAALVSSVRRELGRVQVQHDAGQVPRSLERVDALARSAKRVGYAPLDAELSLLRGRLAMDRRDWGEAGEHLGLALERGIAGGMDSVAAEAVARLVFVAGVTTESETEALEHERLAAALSERIGESPWIVALLANNVGTVYAMHGLRAEATAAFDRAVRVSAEAAEINPIDRAGYLANLAMHTVDAGARSRLFAQADRTLARALGSHHFKRLDAALRWAEYTVDPEEALERIAPLCEALRSRTGDDARRCHLCASRQAELHDLLEQADAAVVALGHAAACIEPGREVNGHPPYMAALREVTSAYAALLRGDSADALPPLERAENALRPKADLPWIADDLADVTLLRERAHQALGQPVSVEALREAIAVYEQRMAMNEDQAPRYRRRMALELLDQSQAQTSSPP